MLEKNIKRNHFFGILSTAASKAITRKWLQPDPPEYWYDVIHEIFVM